MHLARQFGPRNDRFGANLVTRLDQNCSWDRKQTPFADHRAFGDGQTWCIRMSHIRLLKKSLFHPPGPRCAETHPFPHCVLGRVDSSPTNSYAAGTTLPAALLGNGRVLARLGGWVTSPALLSSLDICLENMVVV